MGYPLPFLSRDFHNWIFYFFCQRHPLICTGGGTSNKTEELDIFFIQTSFKNKTLSAITQAGLVNNLNDGMIWGLLPIVLLSMNYDSQNIGIIAAISNSLGLRSIIYRKNV
jgi:hypothetical protein